MHLRAELNFLLLYKNYSLRSKKMIQVHNCGEGVIIVPNQVHLQNLDCVKKVQAYLHEKRQILYGSSNLFCLENFSSSNSSI
jgi:hypothetical protein